MSTNNTQNKTHADFKTVEEYRQFVEERMALLKNKDVRRDVMQSILNGKKYPNPNGVLNSWMEQACGVQTHFTNEPKSTLDIEVMKDVLSAVPSIEVLAKGLGNYIFGGKNPDEYISPKHDMKVKNLLLPETPKSEKVPFFLSPQKLEEITTNPIIPICRKEDYLVMLGKDSKTNEAVTFLMGVPQDNAYGYGYADSELSMYLYVGGIQPKYMGRTSYKPTSKNSDAHAQMHIENGKLCQNEDKSLIDTFDTKVVHYHSYLSDKSGHLGTVITNPRHYTALIKDGDNDYLPEDTATCQEALQTMMNKFNVLTPKCEKVSDTAPLPQDLTGGALVSLGILEYNDQDIDDIPLTAEFYDLILTHYQSYIKTGEQTKEPYSSQILEAIYPSEQAEPQGQQIVNAFKEQYSTQQEDICQ